MRAGGEFFERIEDTLRRLAVPKRWLTECFFGGTVQCGIGCRDDFRRVGAYDHVRPHLDRDRTLGVLAQCEARYSERRRLFLDAAGIRQHQTCAAREVEKVEIAERFDYA